jgi:hypothetical protein
VGRVQKAGISGLFIIFALAFLSWSSGTYGQYCDHIDPDKENCPSYNLLPFFFFKLTDFFNDYEATFIVLSTLAIAWFTYELRKATVGLKDSTDKLWKAGEKQLQYTQRSYIPLNLGVFFRCRELPIPLGE